MDRVSQFLALTVVALAPTLSGCALIGAALPYAGVKMVFACIPEHTTVDTLAPRGPLSRSKRAKGSSALADSLCASCRVRLILSIC